LMQTSPVKQVTVSRLFWQPGILGCRFRFMMPEIQKISQPKTAVSAGQNFALTED